MNTDHLKGTVAIVTGASRGIGRSIATTLAGIGVKVVLAARSEADLRAVQSEITDRGGDAVAIPTDITREQDIQALVAGTVERFGRLDILVNNAGAACGFARCPSYTRAAVLTAPSTASPARTWPSD